MSDVFKSYLESCCSCCYECCCPGSKRNGDKFSSVRYSHPDKAHTVEMPDVEKAPLNKFFQYQQPTLEFRAHPQMTHSSVVSAQPLALSTTPISAHAVDGESHRLLTAATTPEDSGFVVVDTRESHSTLHFSLYYDVQRRVLSVHLLRATNLMAKTRMGMCRTDPFVVLFLQPDKDQVFESEIVKRTVDPLFDAHFDFTGILLQDLRRQSLVLRVYNHDKYVGVEHCSQK